MSKRKRNDYDDDAADGDEAVEQQPQSGVVQPGCSTPDTVPPSVAGTEQDPNRKKKED